MVTGLQKTGLWHDWIVRVSLALSVVFLAITWLLFLQGIRRFAELIPLHYNIYFGVDSFGSSWRLIGLPIVGMLIIIGNSLIGWRLFERNRLLAYFLFGSMGFMQLCIMIGLFLITRINL